MYARHGRETYEVRLSFRAAKSSVCESCYRSNRSKSTSRRQGRDREVRSGGSRSANPLSRRTETTYKAGSAGKPAWYVRSPGFSGSGKCRGCMEKVRVLIRGDLSGIAVYSDRAGCGNVPGDRAGVSRGHSSFV